MEFHYNPIIPSQIYESSTNSGIHGQESHNKSKGQKNLILKGKVPVERLQAHDERERWVGLSAASVRIRSWRFRVWKTMIYSR